MTVTDTVSTAVSSAVDPTTVDCGAARAPLAGERRVCVFVPGHAAGYDWIDDAWVPMDDAVAPPADPAVDVRLRLVREMLRAWPTQYVALGEARCAFERALVELIDLATMSHVVYLDARAWWLRWTMRAAGWSRTRAMDMSLVDRKTLLRWAQAHDVRRETCDGAVGATAREEIE